MREHHLSNPRTILVLGGDTVLRIAIFVIASAAIAWLSWSSMHDRRSHGFYRFFAFEAILMLFLLNVGYWFSDAFSAHQIVSWVLLIASLFLVVKGFRLLRVVGKPEGPIEATTTLVTQGVYRYIRHPLYSSLLLLGWGIFFKRPSLPGGILVLALTLSLVATARVEEAENLHKFGQQYTAYARRTRMFIPFLF